MNTRYLAISIVAALLGCGHVCSAQNPISPMGVYIPDPSARVFDGRMYIYGSLDVKDDDYCSDHYHVLSSDDLCHWTLTENAFKWKETLYAPDAWCKDGRYYLYFDCPGGAEWVAEGKHPDGPFRKAVQIEGPDQIDPNIFVDDNGQAYYFWGQFSGKGAKMNPDLKSLDWSTMVDGLVTEKEHYFHEGSFVFKRGKYYYYTYASIRRQNQATCLSYAMSESPLGPYVYKGEIIDNAGCDPGVWNDHGSVVEFKGKWYVLYHRSTHGTRFMRKACIEPIEFREDGTIIEAEMTTQGAAGPLDAFQQLDAARACLLHGDLQIRLDSPSREVLCMKQDGWAAYKYLDFGDKAPSSVTIRVRPGKSGWIGLGLEQVYWGSEVDFDLPEGNGRDWVELTAKLDSDITGVHAIFLHLSSDTQDGIDVDWIRFNR